MSGPLSESERFPLLSERGRKLLHQLLEDERAPIWDRPCGDQLDAKGLEQVRAFARRLASPPPRPAGPPEWLRAFSDYCLRQCPHHRRHGVAAQPFEEIPTSTRAELSARPWDFVPDDAALDGLIVLYTSGTTGHPSRIPAHPATAAAWLPLLEVSLARHGVPLERGPDRVAFMNVCALERARTGPMVVSYLDEAGQARVNLLPSAWRKSDDCPAFLDRWRPPVFTTDPLGLDALSRVPLRYQPRAILSSAMTLSPSLTKEMEGRLGCPILDVYALAEAGPIALAGPGGHEVLDPDVYVEVVDEDDRPCPPGERGEVTLTGGRNPFLPLLRYRTGDSASLGHEDGKTFLVGLEGRRPVLYRAADGRAIPSLEVARALRPYPLVQFGLHQEADGRLLFRYRGAADLRAIEGVLTGLFGGVGVSFEALAEARVGGGKVVPYSRDAGG